MSCYLHVLLLPLVVSLQIPLLLLQVQFLTIDHEWKGEKQEEAQKDQQQ